MDKTIEAAEVISLFCRMNLNAKRDLPIRASEMGMLIFIVKADQAPTPVQIAGFFKISKPMVTAMAAKLVKAGYIVKSPSDSDRRSFTFRPTEQGKSVVEETYSEYLKTIGILKSRMGAQKFDELIDALNTANEILEEEK